MEGGALLQENFKEFAKDYVLYCHVTSRIENDKYGNLLSEKGGGGFPYLTFMDAKGNVIAKHQGPRRVSAFKTTGARAAAFLELVKKAKGGDRPAQIDLLLMRLDLGHLDEKEAKKEAAKIGKMPADKEEKFQVALSGFAVREILEHLPRSQEQAIKIGGPKFAAMRKAGRPSPEADDLFQPYWIITMLYSEEQKDAETYELALEALKKKYEDSPQAKSFLDQAAETLKELKELKKE